MKKCLFLLAILPLVFSCSKDEDPVDVRAQAVGTYDYTAKYYVVSDGDVSYLEDEDEIGTMVIETDANGIVSKEGGEVIFKGEKIAEASNGFTFDIPSQTLDGVTINGFQGVDLGGTKYDGAYFSGTKELKAYFEAPITASSSMRIYYVAKKK